MYKRNNLKDIPEFHPVVIIGGGIVGAGIFRDLCLHNVDTLIIDKNDFSSQTSQSSSKMLHGGIRYLENMDFSLIWEALHEKNLWLRIAPHLCYPKHFFLPVYKNSTRPLWMIKVGVFLYDLLSSFKNVPHRTTNAKETKDENPLLNPSGLKGAGVYSDAIVDDAKMTLECIFDGIDCHESSYACNYTSLISATKTVEGHTITLKDEHSSEQRTIKCNYLVFATGPFTDQLLSQIDLFNWTPKLALSKGSHLWFNKEDFPLDNPVVLTPKDGRVIFVIPQANRVLVGTTETSATAQFNQLASDEEIEYLIENLKEFFPQANLKKEHIRASFAGLRPLVKEDESSQLAKVARHHKIYQPCEDVFVVLGGKYTTFRVMASDLVKMLFSKMGKAYQPYLSTQPLRRKALCPPWKPIDLNEEKLRLIIENEFPKTREDLILRRMGIWNLEDYPQVKKVLEKNSSYLDSVLN